MRALFFMREVTVTETNPFGTLIWARAGFTRAPLAATP